MRFDCPECGQAQTTRLRAGEEAVCDGCGARIAVPGDAEEPEVRVLRAGWLGGGPLFTLLVLAGVGFGIAAAANWPDDTVDSWTDRRRRRDVSFDRYEKQREKNGPGFFESGYQRVLKERAKRDRLVTIGGVCLLLGILIRVLSGTSKEWEDGVSRVRSAVSEGRSIVVSTSDPRAELVTWLKAEIGGDGFSVFRRIRRG